jgi:hypothetical protein
MAKHVQQFMFSGEWYFSYFARYCCLALAEEEGTMGCHNQPDGEQLGHGGDNLPTDEVLPEPNDAQSERSATKVGSRRSCRTSKPAEQEFVAQRRDRPDALSRDRVREITQDESWVL